MLLLVHNRTFQDIASVKGKPAEKQGRKATDLKLERGHDH